MASHHPQGPFPSGPIADPIRGPVEAGERDANFDNQPPLEERIVMDFMEEIASPGMMGAPSIRGRIDELLISAAKAPASCDSEEIAGSLGDFCKLAREVASRLEEARDKHNRPLLNAQRSLKARADNLIQPLNDAVAKMRDLLNDFTRREAQRREDARRKEEEARRIADEAARASLKEQGHDIAEDQPLFAPAKAPAPAPIARGNYGSSVGSTTVYRHEIDSIRQLPDRLLKHPKVKEQLDKLIAAEIRSARGQIEIKGVRIWKDTAARVR